MPSGTLTEPLEVAARNSSVFRISDVARDVP
jgi:hypothetical protein